MPTAVYTFIDLLFTALTWAIIGRALISWFDPGFNNPISRILFEITEPILGPIRGVLGQFTGGMPIDFSPIIAILLLNLLQNMLLSSL